MNMLEDSGLRTFGGECLKKVCSFLSKFLLQNYDDLSIDGGRSPPLGLRAYLPRGYILVDLLGARRWCAQPPNTVAKVEGASPLATN